MQVLKEKVRIKIVQAAEKEFKELGFEKTSMRTIAANAYMTVGNLYRYYRNKEELFGAVVDELVVELKKLMACAPEEAPGTRFSYLFVKFKGLQQNHFSEWLTLFGGSTGTKYKETTDEIHRMFKDSMVEIIQKSVRHPEAVDVIASSIIFGLNSILQSSKTGRNPFELADEFLNYMNINYS